MLILIPKLLGLNWVEVSGIVLGTWAFGFTAFQIIKSNSSEEKSSLKELREELTTLINDYKEESSEKDKTHDDDLKAIQQETSLLPMIIQEHYRIKDEIANIIKDLEQLSAGVAQANKYAEVLKRQTIIEKSLAGLLKRLEAIEKAIAGRTDK